MGGIVCMMDIETVHQILMKFVCVVGGGGGITEVRDCHGCAIFGNVTLWGLCFRRTYSSYH
jgi:hypothetical protein